MPSSSKSKPDASASVLSAQVKRKTFASSYLFSGHDGEKKTELARAFAKALNCETATVSGRVRDGSVLRPDGPKGEDQNLFRDCKCASCAKINSGNHPDVRWYGVDEEAASIKIEEIRELQTWLNLKPYEGKAKVFVLQDAGRLTMDAQNALLKSLEEPPPASVLILIVDKKTDLLDTIVSRCMEVKAVPFGEEAAADILKQDGASRAEAVFLARSVFGNVSLARKRLEAGWFKRKNEWLTQALADRTNGFESFAARPRKEVLELLIVISEWARDAAVWLASKDRSLMIHEDRAEALEKFTAGKSLDQALELFREIEDLQKALEENVNQKLTLARLQLLWHDFFAS